MSSNLVGVIQCVSLALVPTAGCHGDLMVVLVMVAFFFIGFQGGADMAVPSEVTDYILQTISTNWLLL